MVEVEPVLYGLRVIIRPPYKWSAILVADARLLGQLARDMICRLTDGADKPTGKALDQSRIGDFQIHDHVQWLGKSLGLIHVTRETVKNVPSRCIRLCQPLRDPEENISI